MQDYVLKKVTKFKYLASTMSEDGDLDEEVEERIQAGWINWKRLSGVLCDKRLSETEGESFQGGSSTSHDLRSRNMEHQEDPRKEDGCDRDEDAEVGVWAHPA